ncbi:MAG: methylated-DNA--[protein]-cysteine S-methyltransferase [Huintestinicola sp.]
MFASVITEPFLMTVICTEDAVSEVCYGLVEGMEENPVSMEACRQLREYFEGRRRVFQLPLAAPVTEFSGRVRNAMLSVPYGKTASYKDIAEMIGCPGGMRAVGQACHRNPLAIIVPCHRIVGSDGSVTGYAGGIEVKEYLLELEQKP